MQRIAHVSLYKRNSGDVVHFGGVEKFAHFLKMVIPGLEILSTQDMESEVVPGISPWEWAGQMNAEFLVRGLIDEETIVVGDGFWVNGLQGRVKRLISVCHGSYLGTALEYEKNPGDEPHVGEWGLIQENIWKQPEVEVVSVSPRSTSELLWICGIKPNATIGHGIPLDVYKPDGKQKNRLILHVATSMRKGSDIVKAISNRDRFEIEKLGFPKTGTLEEEAELWNRGGVFFMPTRYEGNAYALLEAVACGLVPVAYFTGLACDIPCDVGEITDDHHEVKFIMLLERVIEYYSQYYPREWALENLDFGVWKRRWKAYLEI